MNVIPLFACKLCGAPGRPFDITLVEVKVDHSVGCEECIQRSRDELTAVRPVFESMIAAGVPSDLANDLMTRLLDDTRWQEAWGVLSEEKAE